MRPYVLCALFLLIAAMGNAAPPTLIFGEVKTVKAAATLQPECTATTAPANPDSMTRALTNEKHFTLYFDPDSIRTLPGTGVLSGFRYSFYLADRRQPSPAWYACDTQVVPQGAFADSIEQAQFAVTADGVTETGTMLNVPIHSLRRDYYFLEFPKQTSPMAIDLSDAGKLTIPLRSLVNDFPVVIEKAVKVQPAHSKYWDKWNNASLEADKALLKEDSLQISAPPLHLMTILWGTLTTLKKDAPHDHFTVTLRYRCGLGAVREQPIEIDVRFEPSTPSLLLALIAGSLLGTFAGFTVTGAWKGWRFAAVRAGKSLLYCAIVEAVALLLVAQGSKFTLFDIELDPRQFLSVFIIGVLISGGKAIVRLIKSGGAESQSEPPASAPPSGPPPLPVATPEGAQP